MPLLPQPTDEQFFRDLEPMIEEFITQLPEGATDVTVATYSFHLAHFNGVLFRGWLSSNFPAAASCAIGSGLA